MVTRFLTSLSLGVCELTMLTSFNGACDGSLILADECSNAENAGLSRLCGQLKTVATENSVGVADLIQFAAGRPAFS